jgi:hypothetical protein
MSIFTRLRDFVGLNEPANYDYEPELPTRPIHRTVEEVSAELVARATGSENTSEASVPTSSSYSEISNGPLPYFAELTAEEPISQVHVSPQPVQPQVGSDLQEALEFLNEVEEERNQALRIQQELAQVEATHASIEIVLDSMETQGLTTSVLEERREAALSKGESLRERLHKQRQKPMRQVSANPPIQNFTPRGVDLPPSRPSFPTVVSLSPPGQTTM